MIDTHCHLYDEPLAADLTGVLQRARDAGVTGMVVVGTTLETSRRAVSLAEAHPDVWAAVGQHPDAEEPLDLDGLDRLLASDRVVAVGEIGLDGSRSAARPAEGLAARLGAQEPICRAQLTWARERGLPVLLHSRDATGRLLRLLQELGPGGPGGILHAWAGSREIATEATKLGFLLGVSGVVCRPQATRIRKVLSELPLETLVLETDAPYIGTATRPRGRAEPAQVAEVCQALAKLHHTDPANLAATTTATARRLLGLPG